jgi:hypothetical protein
MDAHPPLVPEHVQGHGLLLAPPLHLHHRLALHRDDLLSRWDNIPLDHGIYLLMVHALPMARFGFTLSFRGRVRVYLLCRVELRVCRMYRAS